MFGFYRGRKRDGEEWGFSRDGRIVAIGSLIELKEQFNSWCCIPEQKLIHEESTMGVVVRCCCTFKYLLLDFFLLKNGQRSHILTHTVFMCICTILHYYPSCNTENSNIFQCFCKSSFFHCLALFAFAAMTWVVKYIAK